MELPSEGVGVGRALAQLQKDTGVLRNPLPGCAKMVVLKSRMLEDIKEVGETATAIDLKSGNAHFHSWFCYGVCYVAGRL